jgi:hypothetical protein
LIHFYRYKKSPNIYLCQDFKIFKKIIYYLVVGVVVVAVDLEQHFLSPPLEQDFVPVVVVVPVVAFPVPVVVVAVDVVPFDFEQQEDVLPSVVAVLLQQDFPLAGSVAVVVAV